MTDPELRFTPPALNLKTQKFGDMEFVIVPRGEFLMGSDENDKTAFVYERPQHKVNIPYDFFMARFPVTIALFQTFVKQMSLKTKCEVDGFAYSWDGEDFRISSGANWRHPFGPNFYVNGLDNHPVMHLTWEETQIFCAWLNREYASSISQNLVFRLPTEAEWEKAARGLDGRIYPWGNNFDTQKCNSYESGERQTTSVGLYSPQGDSPFGCADMSGNVWEWTANLYGNDPAGPEYGYPYNSRDGRENQKAEEDIMRIIRGGSFDRVARISRVAMRDGNRGPSGNVGFRVALAPDLS